MAADPTRDTPEPSDLDRLCAIVWADPALQDRLRVVTDEPAFVAAVVDVAATSGLRIDAAEVRARMRGNFAGLMLPGLLA